MPEGQQQCEKNLNRFIGYLHKNKIANTFRHLYSLSTQSQKTQRKCLTTQHERNKTESPQSLLKIIRQNKLLPKSDKNQLSMFRLCDNNMSVSIDFSPKHKKQFALKPKRVRYDSRQPSRKINSEPRDSLFKANFDSKHRKLQFRHHETSIQLTMKELRNNYNSDNLFQILQNVSHCHNSHNWIRVSREAFHNIYKYRYGKDKITTFFNFQPSIDQVELVKLAQQALAMTHDQFLLLSFLIYDYNGDGLISNNDLFRICTLDSSENTLISKDVYQIVKYVSDFLVKKEEQLQLSDKLIKDNIDFYYFSKPQAISLKKYRVLRKKQQYTLKKQKIQKDLQMKSFQKAMRSRQITDVSLFRDWSEIKHKIEQNITQRKPKIKPPIKQMMISFRQEEDQEGVKQEINYAKVILKVIMRDLDPLRKCKFVFEINFERFQTIFAQKLPQIVFDVLFTMFNIRIPGKQYLKVEILQEKEPKIVKPKQIAKPSTFYDKLKLMKSNYRSINLISLRESAFHSQQKQT